MAKSIFNQVKEELERQGIDVILDQSSVIYVDRKTGVKIIDFINGLGPSSERLLLEKELKESLSQVKSLVKAPLNSNQAGALASFIHHIGVKKKKKSSVLFALNEGNYKDIPFLMQRYRVGKFDRDGESIVRQDYMQRRQYEAELFSTPDHLNWRAELEAAENTLYPEQRNLSFGQLRTILKHAKKRAYMKLGIFI